MKRINLILDHPHYSDYYNQIEELEEHRLFCRHDMTHFMDVARIAYIFYLEDCVTQGQPLVLEGFSNPKEAIYAAALLHDIGRHLQYTRGEPHEVASQRLCDKILSDSGFNSSETDSIKEAIGNHRNHLIKDDKTLSAYLYRGDKASRPCFSCPGEKACKWPRAKKNLTLTI